MRVYFINIYRGHGTYLENGSLLAATAGNVRITNRLCTLQTARSPRYTAHIGDVVVGRIIGLASKRWALDVLAHQNATLLLSSINLPGGIQRRKSEEDERMMRRMLKEGDMVVCEVQAFFQDGGMSLHTRSKKYGKLRNGFGIKVEGGLVRRARIHFHILPCGVGCILGVNGWIWVYWPEPEKDQSQTKQTMTNDSEEAEEDEFTDRNMDLTKQQLETLARVGNCIRILASHQQKIDYPALLATYNVSLSHEVSTMINQSVAKDIMEAAGMGKGGDNIDQDEAEMMF